VFKRDTISDDDEIKSEVLFCPPPLPSLPPLACTRRVALLYAGWRDLLPLLQANCLGSTTARSRRNQVTAEKASSRWTASV
jgi:hypothetical protein